MDIKKNKITMIIIYIVISILGGFTFHYFMKQKELRDSEKEREAIFAEFRQNKKKIKQDVINYFKLENTNVNNNEIPIYELVSNWNYTFEKIDGKIVVSGTNW